MDGMTRKGFESEITALFQPQVFSSPAGELQRQRGDGSTPTFYRD
jgi:hypothetical protein